MLVMEQTLKAISKVKYQNSRKYFPKKFLFLGKYVDKNDEILMIQIEQCRLMAFDFLNIDFDTFLVATEMKMKATNWVVFLEQDKSELCKFIAIIFYA